MLRNQMSNIKRGKRRKAIPNPNRRFMALSEALVVVKLFLGIEAKKTLLWC
jgi:hypothetical protein